MRHAIITQQREVTNIILRALTTLRLTYRETDNWNDIEDCNRNTGLRTKVGISEGTTNTLYTDIITSKFITLSSSHK